jgi:hypothetical protein
VGETIGGRCEGFKIILKIKERSNKIKIKMGGNHTFSCDSFSISFPLSSPANIQEEEEENELDWWWW